MNWKRFATSLSLCLALSVSALASVTYSFSGDVPTATGPFAASFTLTTPDFVTGMPLAMFSGAQISSCVAPLPNCVVQFSTTPGPISGTADLVQFGFDNGNSGLFGYFFQEPDFSTPGVHVADPFHSAGTATLTVTVSPAVPEPGTFGLALFAAGCAAIELRRRAARRFAQDQRSDR